MIIECPLCFDYLQGPASPRTQRKEAKALQSPSTNRCGRVKKTAQKVQHRSQPIVNHLRNKGPTNTEPPLSDPQEEDENVDPPKNLSSEFDMVSSTGLEQEKANKTPAPKKTPPRRPTRNQHESKTNKHTTRAVVIASISPQPHPPPLLEKLLSTPRGLFNKRKKPVTSSNKNSRSKYKMIGEQRSNHMKKQKGRKKQFLARFFAFF